MKIATIQVGSYGLLLNRSIALGPGLNVIRGANETGKSTLLAFVRAMLFGFDKRHRSLAGGRRGGWLDLTMTDGREIRVERYGERSGDGQLRVLDASSHDLGADELPRLLQGVGRNLFQNVFAFGLDELAEFSNLNDREIASRIYGAGSGLGKVSLPQVEADIWGQAEALFKPGGKVLAINTLLRRLEETDKELRGLDLPRDFRQTTEQLQAYEEELHRLTQDLTAIESQRRECERVIGGWEAWVALLAATAAREDLGTVRDLPAGLLEQMNNLEAGQTTKAATLVKTEAKRLEAAEALSRVLVEDEILEARAEIGELATAADIERARSRTLVEVAGQESQTQRDLDDSLARLGPQWNEDQLKAFDDTIATEGDTARFGKALREAGEEVGRSTASREQLLGEIKNLGKQIDGLRSDIEAIAAEDAAHPALDEQEKTLAELAKSIAEAESLELSLRGCHEEMSLVALPQGFDPDATRGRLRAAKRLQRLLEDVASTATLAASSGSEARQSKPGVGVGVGLVGLAVAAACIALGAPIFVGLLALVPGTVAAAILIWPQMLPAPSSEVHGRIRAQVAQARSESVQIAADLGLSLDASPDAAAAYVETCEKQLVNAERLDALGQRSVKLQADLEAVGPRSGQLLGLADRAPSADEISAFRTNVQAARDRRSSQLGFASQLSACERQLKELGRQAATAEEKLTNSQKALGAVGEEWRSWLDLHGLSGDIDPETAKSILEAVTTAKRVLRTLQSLRARKALLEGEQKAFVETAQAAGDRLGLSGEQEGMAIVQQLKARLDVAKDADADRRAAKSKLETAQQSETEARADVVRIEAEIERLQGEYGVDDLQHLREEIKTAEMATSLETEIANRTMTLTALSAPGEALASYQELLQSTRDIADVQQRADDLRTRFNTLDASRRELTEKLGALRGQIASIEHDLSASEKRQLRSDLFAQLQSRSEDWAELALAARVIADCRESYEATHRPAVVQEAERLFVIWTGSRYERLLAPVGGMVEEIQHREGRRVPLADLSKGTAEQLYLALRFGLVSHFTETAEPLPILMDDILVNFDDDRADSAARSIEELAQHHQVIYFTCHPQTPLRGGCEIDLPALQTVTQAQVLQLDS